MTLAQRKEARREAAQWHWGQAVLRVGCMLTLRRLARKEFELGGFEESKVRLEADNAALKRANAALEETTENLSHFNQLLCQRLETQVATIHAALSSLTSAQLKALPKKSQGQLSSAKDAGEALAALLDRLSAMGVLDQVEPEALESLDPEVIFERVEAVLSQRATA